MGNKVADRLITLTRRTFNWWCRDREQGVYTWRCKNYSVSCNGTIAVFKHDGEMLCMIDMKNVELLQYKCETQCDKESINYIIDMFGGSTTLHQRKDKTVYIT